MDPAADKTEPWPDTAPPFLIALAPDCSHAAYAWLAHADLQGARFQQARAATFAFVLPKGEGEPVSGEAWDDNGRYAFAAQRHRQTVRLVHRGYLAQPRGPAGPIPVGVLVEGPGLTARLDADGWLASAELHNSVHLRAMPHAALKMQARLEPASEGPALAEIDTADPRWTWGNLLSDAGLRERAQQSADPRLAGLSTEELFALLQRQDPQGERVGLAIRSLVAWLAVRPGAAAQLEAWLRGRSDRYSGDPWARIALAALSRSGLPAARACLRSLAEDRSIASAMRLHAVLNLGTAQGASAEDSAALRALAKDRSALMGEHAMAPSAALTMLGTLARQPDLRDTPEHAALVGEIHAALHSETDETFLIAAVHSAGNAADPEFLAELQALSSHADPDVRRAVADALRGMPLEAVQGWFAPWLAREAAPAVAAELVDAFALHFASGDEVPAAVLQAALAHLAKVQNSAVAAALVQLAGKASGSAPAAKAALVQRFAAEVARGAAADPALLTAIGQYIDAATLTAATAK